LLKRLLVLLPFSPPGDIEKQRIHGQRPRFNRKDAATTAGFDHCGAKTDFIKWIQFPVRRYERTEESPERDVCRRQIIERADAHRQNRLSGSHTFRREP
jgi:hypothetical protein